MSKKSQKNILWLNNIGLEDVPLVGGKNASLGEMYGKLTKKGINIPDGFALTTKAYWNFLKTNKIVDSAVEAQKLLGCHRSIVYHYWAEFANIPFLMGNPIFVNKQVL